jgi:hypothetical protein
MERDDISGADWTREPSCSEALSRLLPGPAAPGFQNLRAVDISADNNLGHLPQPSKLLTNAGK